MRAHEWNSSRKQRKTFPLPPQHLAAKTVVELAKVPLRFMQDTQSNRKQMIATTVSSAHYRLVEALPTIFTRKSLLSTQKSVVAKK